ncbi:MAG: ABC transporter ATP-binding protein [Nitrospirales bacterium]|nr:ABC transporter ATP-binding protein [Nitrospirales bacterium]
MMELSDIRFHHPHAEDVLQAVSFSVERGQMNTILGPNGSGKTTLFKCIAGVWQPQSGSILFEGQDLTALPPRKRARIIAVVPQEHEPPFPYQVIDVVLMGRVSHLGAFSSPGRHDHEKAEEALELLGISHMKERVYTKISGGERQMVLIARAIAQETPILILDEPTSHLDFRNQVLILSRVRDIVRQRGLTVLMTLHDPNLALSFSDKVVLMKKGGVFAEGTPGDVITETNLSSVYAMPVSVIESEGRKFVSPRL